MIVDTNVLITLTETGDTAALEEQLAAAGQCTINEIIFAEVAGRYATLEATCAVINALDFSIERLSLEECHRAGGAFREYRRRGGIRTAILPDFLIGAQAAVRGWPILTRDRKGFSSYFPGVVLIEPKA